MSHINTFCYKIRITQFSRYKFNFLCGIFIFFKGNFDCDIINQIFYEFLNEYEEIIIYIIHSLTNGTFIPLTNYFYRNFETKCKQDINTNDKEKNVSSFMKYFL